VHAALDWLLGECHRSGLLAPLMSVTADVDGASHSAIHP